MLIDVTDSVAECIEALARDVGRDADKELPGRRALGLETFPACATRRSVESIV
ncbi:oxidoreductase, short chain dehydrogenase/reductase family [Aspergillus luchuensis]|uniref:Oxidoreductase, short chain dehydrogenase/reductase family n=1 Tax=Aspergillus kawachii TaxID=1069201 RepID=A0A146FN09_ASPKA|nr:oxidoreductase, short chain dehydrogenase/reductase family [Aspergillus luchuensis]